MGMARPGTHSTTSTGAAPTCRRHTFKVSIATTSCCGRASNARECARGIRQAGRETIGEGADKGTLLHFNAGGEWLDAFFNLGIKGNAALYLAERINDVGIECSHFSCGAGVAFEACEKGLLGPDKTDGLRLEWGSVEAAEKLVEMAARLQGWLGNLLADGPKQLAEALGGEALSWAVHTKGGTPAMHEWRPLLGQMLRELVASGGMKPQGGARSNRLRICAIGRTGGPWRPTNRTAGRGPMCFRNNTASFTSISGGCRFAQVNQKPDGLNSIVESSNAVTGWNFTLDEALVAGHRSMILQGLFGSSGAGSPTTIGKTSARASWDRFRMANTKASPSRNGCRS